MTEDLVARIHEWLPADVTDPEEIDAALRGTGWEAEWTEATRGRIADRVGARRDIETTDVIRERRRRYTPLGPTDRRETMVRAADGTALGKPENVRTWEDRWGNIMGRNTETGTTKKVTPKEDR